MYSVEGSSKTMYSFDKSVQNLPLTVSLEAVFLNNRRSEDELYHYPTLLFSTHLFKELR